MSLTRAESDEPLATDHEEEQALAAFIEGEVVEDSLPAVVQPAVVPTQRPLVSFSPEQIDAIKNVLCPDLTDPMLEVFLATCKRTGLDPFAKQIYATVRNTKRDGAKLTITTGIDGFRVVAERSGQYRGQEPIQWCGEDGVWVDVWLKKEHPAAARAGVHRAGFAEPLRAVATWDQYAQKGYEGKLQGLWSTMPALMLGKCAEALALRMAFPNDLSGLYTSDEMAQADNPGHFQAQRQQRRELPEAPPTLNESAVAVLVASCEARAMTQPEMEGLVETITAGRAHWFDQCLATEYKPLRDAIVAWGPVVTATLEQPGPVQGSEQTPADRDSRSSVAVPQESTEAHSNGVEDHPAPGGETKRGVFAAPPGEKPFDESDFVLNAAQVRLLHAAMRGVGVDGEKRHPWLSKVLGREVTSTKQLVKADLDVVLEYVNQPEGERERADLR